MLVSHTEDHITHAVIGGKKSMNFGISDDPAFFQILSSALYKDPMLAMVRETICNAWDAHIESGRTNQPLIISLDDDQLTIKDFGPGIPEDLIQPIYGVYGASTKKNDGRQTGGFGLGCKSPFAYTDHFEVTSCHAGVKTIYNMSKSSAEVGGKPSIVPIASFPTDEHGITVRIPLNPEKQNYRLAGLIHEVIFNGDILALVNEEQPATIGLNKAECGFLLINENANAARHLRSQRIYVRYGNVIYPVERCAEYGTLYSKVNNLLERHYRCQLVLQAPADSISITPSRESLTLSETTTSTITDLLTTFLAVFFKNQELMVRHKEMVTEYVDNAAAEDAILSKKLPADEWLVPGIPTQLGQEMLYTKEDFALLEVLLRYSGRRGQLNNKTWLTYIKRYFSQMLDQNLFDRGLYQSWRNVASKNLGKLSSPSHYRRRDMQKESRAATQWWQKRVLVPLVQKLQAALPEFNINDLHFVSDNIVDPGYNKKEIYKVQHVRISSHTLNLVHLLKPVIVVTHNLKTVNKRMGYVENIEGTTQEKGVYFVIEVGRKKGELVALLDGLKKTGVEIIDISGRLPHEQAEYEERQANIKAKRDAYLAGRIPTAPLVKKARPGLVRLDYILDTTHRRIDTKILAESVDPTRITDPEFVMLVSTGKDYRHTTMDYGSKEFLYAVATLYGTKGAVTNKTDALNRFKEKGAMEVDAYLADKIIKELETSPTLAGFFQASPSKMDDYVTTHTSYDTRRTVSELVKVMFKHPMLREMLPQQVTLSEEDELRLVVWQHMSRNYPYARREDVWKLGEKLEAVPLHKEITEFLDKLIANPFLGLIDSDWLNDNLRRNRQDPVFTDQCATFVKSILN